MHIHPDSAAVLLAAAALLASATASAQAPVGPRTDRPQLRWPAASEMVVEALTSVALNGKADTVSASSTLQLRRHFVPGVVHPFKLTRPTAERYSVHADFRDASWQDFNGADALVLDSQRVLPGLKPTGCQQGGRLTVHYQVRYRAQPSYSPVPGRPKPPPDEPAPGSPGRVAPTPEGLPTGEPPPAGLRPLAPATAVSNVVGDTICVLGSP